MYYEYIPILIFTIFYKAPESKIQKFEYILRTGEYVNNIGTIYYAGYSNQCHLEGRYPKYSKKEILPKGHFLSI